jgi:hypothetical protein
MVERVEDTPGSDDRFAIDGGSDDRRTRFWLLRERFDAAAEELLLLRGRGIDPAGRARLSREIIALSLATVDVVMAGSTRSAACLCQPSAASPVALAHRPSAGSGGRAPTKDLPDA